MNILRFKIFILLFSISLAALDCAGKNGRHNYDGQIKDLIASTDSNEAVFLDFCKNLQNEHNATAKKIIRQFIREANKDKNLVYNILELADRHLASSQSPLKNDELYLDFLDAASESGRLSDADAERLSYLREMTLKNRPGTIAADFQYADRSGEVNTLHSFKSEKHILLMFYDPDCNHCIETMDRLKNKDLSSFVRVMAIDVAENQDLWLKSKDTIEKDWIVGFATDSIEDNDTYIFQDMPTLYLLDPEKRVILKDTSIEEIIGYFNR